MSHPDLIPAPGPDKGVGGVVASADPIDRLPPEAAARLHRLRRLRDRAADLLQPANRRQEDAYNRLRRAEDQLRDIEAAYRQGRMMRTEEIEVPFAQRTEEGQRARVQVVRRVAPDEKRLQAERLVVERLSREVEEHRDEQHARGAAFQSIAGVVNRVEAWLTDGLPRRAVLRMHGGPEPKLGKDESPADAVVRLEQQIGALEQRRLDFKALPVHSSEVIARLTEEIDALARSGTPDVFDCVEGNPIAWPTYRQQLHGFSANADNVLVGGSMTNSLALFAWLHKDALLKALKAEVMKAADDANGITTADREAALKEIAANRLAAERVLEHWYTIQEQANVTVFRIDDMAPAAILGVSDPAAKEV